MGGIYVHIPFCKSKCFYCDFYSITDKSLIKNYLNALIKEIKLKRDFFNNQELIDTIYFGGGTPSVLSIKEIELIIDQIFKYFKIDNNYEFTIEVNPDDINKKYVINLMGIGINRISVGIQTLNDKILKIINRRHNRETSLKALDIIFNSGFQNVSVDLIYGLPYQTNEEVYNDLLTILNFPIKHLSAYSLIIEDGTYIKKLLDNKIIKLPEEEDVIEQYKIIIDILKKENFVHYEISNFAKENFYSIHNSNYWKQVKYLGLGPSAHSYDNEYRYMNVADILKYIECISNGEVFYNKEKLTLRDKYNEYILTGLRTMWGVSIKTIENNFKEYLNIFKKAIERYFEKYVKIINNDTVILTEEGYLISDKIISDCFAI